MKKIFLRILIIISSLYIILCVFFFFFQEKLIFMPDKLNKNYKFKFNRNFEEINIKTQNNTLLNGLLFKTESPKGLIFYLHGNAGALDSWGQIAPLYTGMGYDIFILDYRGFGKSEGSIDNENQLFDDVQKAYNEMKLRYDESKIVITGYSIGTCPATKIASENNPRLLILQAPYYNLTNVVQAFCPVMPDFTIRYKLETAKYISKCKMPVYIFHGDKDKIINYSNSLLLKELFKDGDMLITLEGEEHNGITYNEKYMDEIQKILL